MGRIREVKNKNREVRPSYARAAIRCLGEYDEPTLHDIKDEMCYNNYCPRNECEFPKGKECGEQCGHVLAVRLLALKARHILIDE
jgi:hypothetical protein